MTNRIAAVAARLGLTRAERALSPTELAVRTTAFVERESKLQQEIQDLVAMLELDPTANWKAIPSLPSKQSWCSPNGEYVFHKGTLYSQDLVGGRFQLEPSAVNERGLSQLQLKIEDLQHVRSKVDLLATVKAEPASPADDWTES